MDVQCEMVVPRRVGDREGGMEVPCGQVSQGSHGAQVREMPSQLPVSDSTDLCTHIPLGVVCIKIKSSVKATRPMCIFKA